MVIDLQIDFVEMPGRVRLGAASTQVRCDRRPEMVHPAANGLIGGYDPAFRQQIFNVAKAQGKPQIEPDCLLDDFSREPVPFIVDFLHPFGYRTAGKAARPNRRDKAFPNIRLELREL